MYSAGRQDPLPSDCAVAAVDKIAGADGAVQSHGVDVSEAYTKSHALFGRHFSPHVLLLHFRGSGAHLQLFLHAFKLSRALVDSFYSWIVISVSQFTCLLIAME